VNERYDKQGAAVRIEEWGGSRHRTVVRESGHSTLKDGRFASEPRPADPKSDLQPIVRDERPSLRFCRVERISMIFGVSQQQIEDDEGSRAWSDESTMALVSLVDMRSPSRLTATFGGPAAVDDLLAWCRAVDETLGLTESDEAIDALALDAVVTAELWPAIVVSATAAQAALPESDRVRLRQQPPPWAMQDGSGRSIDALPTLVATGEGLRRTMATGTYRPSYRYPPRRLPLHLRAELEPAAATPAVRAVALCAPPALSEDGIALELLCRGARGMFRRRVAMTPVEWMERLRGISDEPEVWTPHLAGSWGQPAALQLKVT
jgi:hypothetical protein